MKRLFTLFLVLIFAVPMFAKKKPATEADSKWEVGYSRTLIKAIEYDQIAKVMADGYHVSGYTCIGGDDHNAPDCTPDSETAQTMYSGRAVAFADGTAYACEPGSCPGWFTEIELVRELDTCTKAEDGSQLCPFHYKVTRNGEVELRNGFVAKFLVVLDGQKHDLRTKPFAEQERKDREWCAAPLTDEERAQGHASKPAWCEELLAKHKTPRP